MASSLERFFRLGSSGRFLIDRIVFFVIAQIRHLRLDEVASDLFSHRRLDPVEQRFLPSLEEGEEIISTENGRFDHV